MFLAFLLIVAGIVIYLFYPTQQLPKGTRIDSIIVYKGNRKMQVFSEGNLIKTYVISLGKNPIGPKQFEGDCKTPEGIYTINARNPNSGYHKNLGVSYPNETDLENAQKLGKSAGGDIKIHGLPNGKGFISRFHRFKDWTAGCIAVTDSEIDELYEAVVQNATIEILP